MSMFTQSKIYENRCHKKRDYFFTNFMYLVMLLPSKEIARPEQCGVQSVIN